MLLQFKEKCSCEIQLIYSTVEPKCVWKTVSRFISVSWIYLNFFSDAGQVTSQIVQSLWMVLAWRHGEGMAVEDECVRPSIAPCLGLEFPLGHSSREAEVSEETLLCPDRLGLQQWLIHNSGTQHWGKVSESITATTDNPFLFCLCLSHSLSLCLRLTRKTFCQEAVSLFELWPEWYEHPIAQFSPTVAKCLLLHVHVAEYYEILFLPWAIWRVF